MAVAVRASAAPSLHTDRPAGRRRERRAAAAAAPPSWSPLALAGGGAGAGAGHVALAARRRTACDAPREWRSVAAPAGVVHLARLAAGAVDGVALAPPARAAATWRCRCGSRWCRWSPRPLTPNSDRALLLGLPAAGHAGRLRAAHLPAQRRGADRLVHAAVLQRLRAGHLGDLDLAADRRAGQARRQRGQAGARLRAQLLAGGLRRWRWRPRWRGSGWCAGAPGATAPRSGRAWCCRPAAPRCAGCC